MVTSKDLAPPAHFAGAQPGDVLRGKWRLDTRLGRGATAQVFAATHRNGTRAALKLLHPWLAGDADTRHRFLAEGYLANAIGHPGVTRAFDDDTTEDGSPFLVLELLAGESVKAQWVARGRRMDAASVLHIAEGVLEALDAVHARGIVHCDVKPDNLFITSDGRVRLLDFGIAHAPGGELQPPDNVMLGTPAYMSPEQIVGPRARVDARTDLYGLGATMWTLLTGRSVFMAASLDELLLTTAREHAPPLATALPGASPALCRVIDRALASCPWERWPDAATMLAAVRAARADLARVASKDLAARSVPLAAPPVRTIPLCAVALATAADTAALPPINAPEVFDDGSAQPFVATLPPPSVAPSAPPRRRTGWAALSLVGALCVFILGAATTRDSLDELASGDPRLPHRTTAPTTPEPALGAVVARPAPSEVEVEVKVEANEEVAPVGPDSPSPGSIRTSPLQTSPPAPPAAPAPAAAPRPAVAPSPAPTPTPPPTCALKWPVTAECAAVAARDDLGPRSE
jgi:serine/threonine protein kinase